MKRHTQSIFTPRILGRIAIILVVSMFACGALKDYLGYKRGQRISRATSLDTLSDRLSSLGIDLESTYSLARVDAATLAAIVGAYYSIDSRTPYIEASIKNFTAEHREYLFLRFTSLNQDTIGGALSAYRSASTTLDEHMFSDLRKRAGGIPAGQALVSSLMSYDTGTSSVPVLHTLMPVFSGGKEVGFLEGIITIDESINEIRRASRPDEWITLIDGAGKYLVDGAKKSVTDDDTSYPPDIAAKLFSDNPVGSFIFGDYVFSYRHIEVPEIVEDPAGRSYWTLVSISRTEAVFGPEQPIADRFEVAIISSFLMTLFISGLVICMIRKY